MVLASTTLSAQVQKPDSEHNPLWNNLSNHASSNTLPDSQEFIFHQQQLSIANDLSGHPVRAIVQDSIGFIWIASKGLYRYDGYTFKHYVHDPADSSSIRSNDIRSLFSDRNCNLWISTPGGLSRYLYTSDSFYYYNFIDEQKEAIPYDITALVQDSSGTYYAALNFAPPSLYQDDEPISPRDYSNRGVYSFDPGNGRFTPLPFINEAVQNLYQRHILTDPENDGVYEKSIAFPAVHFNATLLYRYYIFRKSGRIEAEPFPNPDDFVGFRTLTFDQNLIEFPAVKFDNKLIQSTIKHSGEQDSIRDITVRFSVDMNDWVPALHPGDSVTVFGYLYPLNLERGLHINEMTFDSRGHLWVSVPDYGALIFNFEEKAYKHLFYSTSPRQTLYSNYVSDFFVDKANNIWIANEWGLNKFDVEKNRLLRYASDESPRIIELSHPYLNRVVEYPPENLWLIYEDFIGITRLNSRDNKSTHYSKGFKQRFSSLNLDHSGGIWIGGDNGGITRIDAKQLTFKAQPIFQKSGQSGKIKAVHTVFEDSRGGIWLGGDLDGIYKYNRGTNDLHFFRAIPNNPDSLNSGNIKGFFEDDSGYIWISTRKALNRFDPAANQFRSYPGKSLELGRAKSTFATHLIKNNEKEAHSVYAADVDGDGDMDVLSAAAIEDRVSWYENDGRGSFTAFTIAENEDGVLSVYAADVDSDGDMDVLSACQDPAGDKVVWYENDGRQNFTSHSIVTGANYMCVSAADVDSDGDMDVLASTEFDNKTVWFENDGKQNFTAHFLTSGSGFVPSVSAIDLNQDGNMDIISASAGDKKIFWYENDGNERFSSHVVSAAADDPSSAFAIDLDQDGDIDVLAASCDDNLIAWHENNGQEQFNLHILDSLARCAISVFAVDIDIDGDIDVLSAAQEGNKITLYENDGSQKFYTRVIAGDALGASSVYAADLDGDGDPDVISACKEAGEINWYENIATGNEVVAACKSGDLLWTITKDGHLSSFDLLTGAEKSHYLNEKSVSDLTVDESGLLWILSTSGGLYKFDPDGELFKAEINGEGGSRILSGPGGKIWFNGSGGLFAYDPLTENLENISAEDGLLSNSLTGMEIDNSGNIWITCRQGLSKYNPSAESIVNYYAEDGLITDKQWQVASHKNKKGEIFFAAQNGLAVFHPDSIKEPEFDGPVVLTGLKIKDIPINTSRVPRFKGTISTTKEFTFTHHENDISLTFSALDYSILQDVKYAFRLENYDEKWRQAGTDRTAVYFNLTPGEYFFKVKARNRHNVWQKRPAEWKITILPPWWRSTWAYSGYLFAIIGLLYAFYHYDLRRRTLLHQVELEQLESRKLKEIDQMKSRFFTNISHEFRTPLTLMIGPVEQMLSGEFRGNIKKQYRMILRNGQKLLHLINQLLDIAQLEAGQMILQAAEGDIVDFLKKTVSAFESLAVRQEIDLSLRPPKKLLPVYFDSDKLEKIMTNLLGNAFKFNHKGGSVTVGCQFKNDFVEITVQDNGIGISAERLPHIFNRFYQADDSHTREQEGSGIGLALTKELVELHRGEIFVDSEPGKGTTFTVRLLLGKNHLSAEDIVTRTADFGIPNAAAGYDRPEKSLPFDSALPIHFAASSVSPSVIRNPQSALVLIVEDNPDMRSYLKESLEETYKVLQALDGAQGLKKAVKAIPDLIISDVMMPEMDGYELCRRLKKDTRTSHIPVILLTAKADTDSKIEGLETGADDYLAKPFNGRELLARCKNLIVLRRKLGEQFRQSNTFVPADLALTSVDEQFLQRVLSVIESHLSEPDFSTQTLAKEVGLSRSQLHRKLQGLTGLSTREFVRTLRLKRAAQMLTQKTGNISEIADAVGFKNLSHFSRVFHETFGLKPSEYAVHQSKLD